VKQLKIIIQPGCIGRNEGRVQNSGGIGLHPRQSNTPSNYTSTLFIQINIINT